MVLEKFSPNAIKSVESFSLIRSPGMWYYTDEAAAAAARDDFPKLLDL
jgi:hypothetical protein